jgi:zinc protease
MRIATALLLTLFLAIPATAGDGTLMTRYDLDSGIGETTLENGLRLLTLERHTAPVVSVHLWYRVGSADEPLGATGMAHFLEHMMFKGTDRYERGEIDRITLKLGGSNNAATYKDWTYYYFNFASDRWETALTIEANRMRNAALDPEEFEAERKVVLEELKTGRDSPWGELDETIESVAFLAHPYRHPVIGWRKDVQTVSRATLKAFYDRYYVPRNAVLVLVGDFDTRKAVERVQALFGGIPAGPDIPKRAFVEPEQNGEKRLVIRRDTELARLEILYHSASAGHADDPVLDVVRWLVVGNRSSRLTQRLVEEESACTFVSAFNDTRLDPGLFWIWTELRPDARHEDVERFIHEETARLASEGPKEDELARGKKSLLSNLVFRRANAERMAEDIGQMAMTADWRLTGRKADRLRAVTAADVRRVAGEIFAKRNRTVGWALPNGGAGGGAKRKAGARRSANRNGAAAPAGAAVKLDPEVVRLDNGLTLIVARNTAVPVLAMRAYVDAGRLREQEPGLAHFTGRYLMEGTGELDAKALSERIASLGATVTASGTGLKARCLTEDAEEVAGLVAGILTKPSFPEKAMEKLRGRILSELASEEDDPETVSFRAADRLVYGTHPYGYPVRGTKESLPKLALEDVRSHHRELYVPENTVIAAVSDLPVEDLVRLLTAAFDSWSGKVEKLHAHDGIPPAKPATEHVERETDQVHICLAHRGIRRDNPDYYSLLVMDYVLGMGPGFTDRLSRTLRDRDGLAYSVYASIADSSDTEPGRFLAYIATSADQRDLAIAGIRREIERIRKEPVEDEELSDAKAYLTGSFVFSYETAEQVATRLVHLHRLGLGFDYPATFAQRVNAVTKEDVLRVAAKYLKPEDLATVVVGPCE